MARILIVDDDVQVRAVLRQMLEREGYEARAGLLQAARLLGVHGTFVKRKKDNTGD